MRKIFLLAAALAAGLEGAEPTPRVMLWRMDGGTFVTKRLVDSCYLIRHDLQYLLWDAGLGAELTGHPNQTKQGWVVEVRESLVSQLAELRIKPAQIDILALSHKHSDHIGQASYFPAAKLLIGKEDWDALVARSPDPRLEPGRLAPWITGGAPKELVTGDKDIFGDGSVVMLAMPGHTPGHHSLLVRLKQFGPVLLTGDLYYSAEQYEKQFIPKNEDAAETAASFVRFRKLAESLHATVVIQHEPRDVAKLPVFPNAAF